MNKIYEDVATNIVTFIIKVNDSFLLKNAWVGSSEQHKFRIRLPVVRALTLSVIRHNQYNRSIRVFTFL